MSPRPRRQPSPSSSSPAKRRFRLQMVEVDGDREVVTADLPCDGCLVIVGELPGPRPGRFHYQFATAGPSELLYNLIDVLPEAIEKQLRMLGNLGSTPSEPGSPAK